MGSRKKKNIREFKDYESASEHSSYEVGYIRMLEAQLVCMNELSANAFRLYIMMKSYAQGEVEFNYPHRIYKDIMSNQTFKVARQELINMGYLEPFVSHKTNRTENEYRFSSKWRERNKEKIKETIENRKTKSRSPKSQ